MLRLFFPFVLIAAAIGLFFLYTDPTYQDIKSLAAQNASYDEALAKAQELHQVRDDLLAKRNSFSPDDLDKLQHLLPDNVDNIRLIIDINNIASRHSLSLSNVNLSDANASSGAGSSATTDTGPVGSITTGFSVSTSNYDDFLAFLQDLEHSLRLTDVMSVSLSSAPGVSSPGTYQLTVRTYWLQ